MGRPVDDLRGRRFGQLIVTRLHHKSEKGVVWWECICDCGRLKVVRATSLKQGHVTSCGHRLVEAHQTHGDSKTRLYHIWINMKARCYNPRNISYSRYGGVGITVCDEWRTDFAAFKKWALSVGYNDSLSLDRIDNSVRERGYSPENCRFVGIYEQANNKTNNYHVTYKGRTQTLPEWSRELGIKVTTLRSRLERNGWDAERAFTTAPNGLQGTMYEHMGVTRTLERWSEVLNIPRATLRKRINSGMSIKEAFTTPLHRSEKLLEYKGEVRTQADWGRVTGLGEVLRNRLRSGWSLEKAIETPVNENRTKTKGLPVTYNGDTMPLKELCVKYGKNYHSIQSRLQRGWTLEEAMSTPASDGHHSRKKGKRLVRTATV